MSGLNHVQRVRLLYKTILRLHRGLPKELQELGQIYVRDEFRRHKNCNPKEAQTFMIEWSVCIIIFNCLRCKDNETVFFSTRNIL